ncbi:hypothetical protein BaRGS_00001855 [Batillaria attramentaria]|uniref:Uncharacterized protein n=1 Tax=Batillaria attramentaria TaxID=370345 RepID=A0ABD0M509_9CAEN
MGLAVQVIVQECIILVLVLLGSAFTVLVGYHQLRRLINKKRNWSVVGKTSENTEPDGKGGPVAAEGETDEDRTPLLRDAEEPDQSAGHIPRASLRNYRTNTPAPSNLTASSNDCMDSGNRTSPQITICVRGSSNFHRGNNSKFKRQIFWICLTVFFSAATICIFSMLTTDYVGKAIYGGNPEAEPGSDSLSNYQTGVRLASVGFVVYYSSYLLASVCHKRAHSVLGYRVVYIVTHVAVSGSMLALALTARMEVFFVVCVLAGFQRASFFVIPFAVTNDIIQSQTWRSGQDGSKRLGTILSVVCSMVSLSYSTIFASTPPLEHVTGVVSTPLWIGAALGCLSTISFLLVGKI